MPRSGLLDQLILAVQVLLVQLRVLLLASSQIWLLSLFFWGSCPEQKMHLSKCCVKLRRMLPRLANALQIYAKVKSLPCGQPESPTDCACWV